jgi:hypothetical protein
MVADAISILVKRPVSHRFRHWHVKADAVVRVVTYPLTPTFNTTYIHRCIKLFYELQEILLVR